MKSHLFSFPRLLPLAASSLLFMTGLAQAQTGPATAIPIVIGPIEPIAPPPIGSSSVPRLSGSISGVSIKPTSSGNSLKVKGLVTLRNKGTEAARNVTADVYLSSSSTLDSDAQPIAKLSLATFYHGDGKVEPHAKVSLPLKYVLPKLLAPALSGQYLIVVLSAGDEPKKLITPIVYGPLPKVP